MRSAVHFVPIITTVVSFAFAGVVLARWMDRRSPHLLWWGIGMLTYGAGTITESTTTLLGWSEPVFRAWYITGALLGGAPLAQGSVYLHLGRRTADRLTVLLGLVVTIAAACVLASPIDHSLVEPFRLTGRVFEWQWVRLFSPFINLYAVVFLVGGAVVSALRYRRDTETYYRFLGNVYIAAGGILPGIGGAFTRFGHTEVLYVTELLGLLLIFVGYRLNTRPRSVAVVRELHAA
ncbi:MAG TPA: hypothetical protein VFZ21_22915 [Gemmatimonadaceae bacterium]|nr:hypothetical protein [Gemmatimonadaceae bacterium]